ncbi:MAG: ABC transporter ATP-binding protein [Planctomycetes bacterium]|nr:ABC transporter ATP-binding protein [Planctomycetota bacterium]
MLDTCGEGVNIDVPAGATVALVGESGCGKSATALAIMGLIAHPGRIRGGEILFEGRDLRTLPPREYRALRGGRIAMIFQEPMTCLNPVVSVGAQIVEAVRLHQRLSLRDARARTVEMLEKVGIASPRERMYEFPHQLSGGMRQRVMIAMALVCRPALLLADEPTTALDVTTQAQILELLRKLQHDTGMSMLLITHDLGVAAQAADYVYVMYAGKIVEHAPVAALFAAPLHPYTRGLLESMPRLGRRTERLTTIPGSVPDPRAFPSGCRFHPRCEPGRDDPQCRDHEPPLERIAEQHDVACWKAAGYPATD